MWECNSRCCSGGMLSFYILLGASLLPSYFVYVLVEDRKMNTKHQVSLSPPRLHFFCDLWGRADAADGTEHEVVLGGGVPP